MITFHNLCSKLTNNELTGWQMFYLASVIIRNDNEYATLLYERDICKFIKTYYNHTVNDILKCIYNYHKQTGFLQHHFDNINKS